MPGSIGFVRARFRAAIASRMTQNEESLGVEAIARGAGLGSFAHFALESTSARRPVASSADWVRSRGLTRPTGPGRSIRAPDAPGRNWVRSRGFSRVVLPSNGRATLRPEGRIGFDRAAFPRRSIRRRLVKESSCRCAAP
jgi:hypothetical protein